MKIVNETEFKDIVKEGVTLVDFFATWCGPCKALAPVLEELSAQYPNVNFIKVIVDESENLASEYGIMSIPTVLVFKNGELVKQNVGFMSPQAVNSLVDSVL